MTDHPLEEKYRTLIRILSDTESAAIAFSGGVDSAFLLYAAQEALGDRAVAITATSPLFPKQEQEEARRFCTDRGIRQFFYSCGGLDKDHFRTNPADRCYYCKKDIFSGAVTLARELGIRVIAEGSNMDDLSDHRPGMQAVSELGILSPLRQAGLYKTEIRTLSEQFGLPTWDKPSGACLASRFAYGEPVTEERLRMVESAEEYLRNLGFRQCRVRIHGDIVRLEVPFSRIPEFLQEDLRMEILTELKALGFSYITLDLQGYRTGSMNETL